ncbi:DNA-3-methyladenine glycosylase I, partial [mine drainage metagenome]
NARVYIEIIESGKSFGDVVWSYRPEEHASPASSRDISDETEESRRMSRDLKGMGFAFVGPTICYSLMQGAGLVNDHVALCPIGMEIARRETR